MKCNNYKSFTLIELLIVIVIIGILAVAMIPRLTGIQAKARDTKRMADLKQIQTALEMYANDNNGNYPSTSNGWRGLCPTFSGGGLWTTSGPNGYVPYLAPDYLDQLPTDPKPVGSYGCYLYRSNGIDYMFLIYRTIEGQIPEEFKRPAYPNEKNFAAYSPGGKMY